MIMATIIGFFSVSLFSRQSQYKESCEFNQESKEADGVISLVRNSQLFQQPLDDDDLECQEPCKTHDCEIFIMSSAYHDRPVHQIASDPGELRVKGSS